MQRNRSERSYGKIGESKTVQKSRAKKLRNVWTSFNNLYTVFTWRQSGGHIGAPNINLAESMEVKLIKALSFVLLIYSSCLPGPKRENALFGPDLLLPLEQSEPKKTTGLSAKSWTLYPFSLTVFVLDFFAIWPDVVSDWDIGQNGRGYFTRYECGWILLLSQTQLCKKVFYFSLRKGSSGYNFYHPMWGNPRQSWIVDSTHALASGFQVLDPLSPLQRPLFVVARLGLGRKRKKARGEQWEGERELLQPFPSSHRSTRAFYFWLLLFLLGYPAGAFAEEKAGFQSQCQCSLVEWEFLYDAIQIWRTDNWVGHDKRWEERFTEILRQWKLTFTIFSIELVCTQLAKK